jgi:hypothetical protein
MKIIAEGVAAAYQKEFSAERIKALEKRIAKLDRELDKAVKASIQAPDKGRQRYYDMIEDMETQKLDVEVDLSRLRIAAGIRCEESHVLAWLKTYCKGDPHDADFQKYIIDTFINSVYVYDDKLVIYYNLKGGKQVSYMEMIDSTSDPPRDDAEGKAVQFSTSLPHQKKVKFNRNNAVGEFPLP